MTVVESSPGGFGFRVLLVRGLNCLDAGENPGGAGHAERLRPGRLETLDVWIPCRQAGESWGEPGTQSWVQNNFLND